MSRGLGAVVLALALASPSAAFEIDPATAHLEVARPGSPLPRGNLHGVLRIRSAPIHEQLTINSLERALAQSTEPRIRRLLQDPAFVREVLHGVRWNDDPIGYMPQDPNRFGNFMVHGALLASANTINTTYDLMYRSHYVDLQFLHAMANRQCDQAGDGECDATVGDTQDRIVEWFKMAYAMADATLPPAVTFASVARPPFSYRKLGHPERFDYACPQVPTSRDGRNMTPQCLFTLKCTRHWSLWSFLAADTWLDCASWKDAYNRQLDAIQLKGRALGAMLHTVQDSFSRAHTVRLPAFVGAPVTRKSSLADGPIVYFQMYPEQSSVRHSVADDWPEGIDRLDGAFYEASAALIREVMLSGDGQPSRWQAVETLARTRLFNVVRRDAPNSVHRLFRADGPGLGPRGHVRLETHTPEPGNTDQ